MNCCPSELKLFTENYYKYLQFLSLMIMKSKKVDEIKNSRGDNSKEYFYITKLITSALNFDSNLFNTTDDEGVEELGILNFINLFC